MKIEYEELVDPQQVADEVRENNDKTTRENAAWTIEKLCERLYGSGFSHNPPDQEGYYWFIEIWKGKVFSNVTPSIVEVKKASCFKKPAPLQFQRIGGHATRMCSDVEGWWSGPLKPPEMPDDYPFKEENLPANPVWWIEWKSKSNASMVNTIPIEDAKALAEKLAHATKFAKSGKVSVTQYHHKGKKP